MNDTTGDKAYGMWLASPGSGSDWYILNTTNEGGLFYANRFTEDGIGIRPMVCLKSGVQLEKVSEGAYRIM